MADLKVILRFISVLFLSLFLGACATKTHYYWGNFEEILYLQYANPGKASPEFLLTGMEEDIHKAQSSGKPLPPGFYAHLGYLLLQTGKPSEAKASFLKETRLFPESKTLMSRFIKKLN